jgi:hypothetical protein
MVAIFSPEKKAHEYGWRWVAFQALVGSHARCSFSFVITTGFRGPRAEKGNTSFLNGQRSKRVEIICHISLSKGLFGGRGK